MNERKAEGRIQAPSPVNKSVSEASGTGSDSCSEPPPPPYPWHLFLHRGTHTTHYFLSLSSPVFPVSSVQVWDEATELLTHEQSLVRPDRVKHVSDIPAVLQPQHQPRQPSRSHTFTQPIPLWPFLPFPSFRCERLRQT